MRDTLAVLIAMLLLASGASARQAPSTRGDELLGTVTIGQPVLAGGKPLAPGTYTLRLSNEPVSARPGQSPDAQRRVDLVKNGMVVAREVAEVLRDEDAEPGRAQVTRPGVRVELLKGGEFVRVSVRRGSERYLIYLPTASASTTP